MLLLKSLTILLRIIFEVDMEILKKGSIVNEEKTYDAKCKKCGSELRFSESDGFVHNGRFNEKHLQVSCPVCQSDVWVDL